jgi:hypothetical protein
MKCRKPKKEAVMVGRCFVLLSLSLVAISVGALSETDANSAVYNIILAAGYNEPDALLFAQSAQNSIDCGYPAALFTSTASRWLIRDGKALRDVIPSLLYVWRAAAYEYAAGQPVGEAAKRGLAAD